jgi:hypothetical protein
MMNNSPFVRAVPALLALLLAACGSVPRITFEHAGKDDDSVAAADWQEEALALPAAPKADQLLAFYVSPTTPMRHAIDAPSLAVGKDGTVRYTLVATGPDGARNVSYEAVHCRDGAVKRYAVGRADGGWARTPDPQWTPIAYNQPNGAQGVLARDYFCQGRTVDGSAANLLAKLRRNGGLTAAPIVP